MPDAGLKLEDVPLGNPESVRVTTSLNPPLSSTSTVMIAFSFCLMVSVESSGWLFELQTKHKNKILKKLKSHLGEDRVKDVKFKIGETRDAA